MNDEIRDLDRTEKRARDVFDTSVEQLDGPTRASLGHARRKAVAAVDRPRPAPWRTWIPVAAVASTVMVAVLLMRAPEPATSPPAAVAQSGDAVVDPVELVADGDDLDLLQNDLEFYEWLDATGLAAGGSTG